MNAKKKTVPSKKKKPAAKKAKPPLKIARPEGLSALDAAARVLAEGKEPLSTREIIEQAAAKGYWQSPKGLTPWATLNAAIRREMAAKGTHSRFRQTELGRYAFRAPKGGA